MAQVVTFAALVIIAIILVIFLFPLWDNWVRGNCSSGTGGGCPTSTTGTGCFPGHDFPVKSGLFDLRNCTDDEFYVLGNSTTQSKFVFLTEAP